MFSVKEEVGVGGVGGREGGREGGLEISPSASVTTGREAGVETEGQQENVLAEGVLWRPRPWPLGVQQVNGEAESRLPRPAPSLTF